MLYIPASVAVVKGQVFNTRRLQLPKEAAVRKMHTNANLADASMSIIHELSRQKSMEKRFVQTCIQ